MGTCCVTVSLRTMDYGFSKELLFWLAGLPLSLVSWDIKYLGHQQGTLWTASDALCHLSFSGWGCLAGPNRPFSGSVLVT